MKMFKGLDKSCKIAFWKNCLNLDSFPGLTPHVSKLRIRNIFKFKFVKKKWYLIAVFIFIYLINSEI